VKNNSLLRTPQLFAGARITSIVTTAFGLFIGLKPALAEFEIQEAGIEKGEVELEYRGAVHWGFPNAERGEAEDDGALDTEEAEASLRQSHDFEAEWGVNNWWLLAITLGTEQPLGEDFNLTSVELETQVELKARKGNGIGLAFQAGYGIATIGGAADEIEFGPIIELASGKALLTINPLFGAQVGENRETDGLGFGYGWRAEYDFAKHWGIGVEMFGEIEDLANAGSFNDQQHSIGPTLFFKPGGDDDDEEVGDVGESDDNGKDNNPEPAKMEFSMNVGVQFGLTDVTSDSALKFQGSLAF
jgi:hypothetical protein